ncbi:MAG: YeeE/YedE family protein [Ottowia sp.]|nr:YeeE/YedE family protein [Ottowia sp.]
MNAPRRAPWLAYAGALFAGGLFGLGLLISGMTDPVNVIGFLDVTGAWNPRLAFVMGAAVVVAAPAFWWVGRRGRTLAGEAAQLPTARNIDRRLVAGSLLFGIGWGLAGICPGPGIVATALGSGQAAVFVIAMAAGMLAWRLWQRPRA